MTSLPSHRTDDPKLNRKQQTVTRLLEDLRNGERHAIDQLFAILYHELKELAGRQRRRWRDDHTINTTALVHEAYIKLVGQARIEVENRAHFSALAARAMRHILCDYARDRQAQKRGGGLERVSLDHLRELPVRPVLSDEQSDILLTIEAALLRLERINPRQSKVVECRFFGGLTIEETALAAGISPRTVKRDWNMAQAWLHREMESHA
jgi:RNA polymerase sigma factor (TIGR02999 family)